MALLEFLEDCAGARRIACVQSRMPAMRADRADEPDVATVRDYTWRRGVVVALWVYALAILVADVAAGLAMGSIIATLVFVGLWAATVLSGLGLSADDHAHRPAFGESDFMARWIVHALPLRVAREGGARLVGAARLRFSSSRWVRVVGQPAVADPGARSLHGHLLVAPAVVRLFIRRVRT